MLLSNEDRMRIIHAQKGQLKELANDLNMNPHTLRARRSEWKRDMYVLPEPVQIIDDEPMQLDTANFLVLADVHAPYHNKLMIERALKVARIHFPHVEAAIFAGDLYNFERISHHPVDGPSTSTSTDIRTAGAILRKVMENFERVYVFPGNHDRRLMKAMKSEYDFAFVVHGSLGNERPRGCELYTSNLSYMYAPDWLIYHPSSYSGFGGKTPAEQAQLDQINVIGSHNHVMGLMQSKDGRFIGVDPGHLTDEKYHWYHIKDKTKFAKWCAGFVIVSNGKPYVFNDLITDWRALGVTP